MKDKIVTAIPGIVTLINVNDPDRRATYYFYYLNTYCFISYEIDHVKSRYTGFNFFLENNPMHIFESRVEEITRWM